MMDYIIKRKNDPKSYMFTNGYKTIRKYYKTINVPEETAPFVTPVLSSNGVYGQGAFSIKAVPKETWNLYYAFDNNGNTFYYVSNPGSIYFYTWSQIKVSSILFAISSGSTSTVRSYGSNDGSQWKKLGSANPGSGSFTLNVNSSDFYHYYRVDTTGGSKDYFYGDRITITADELIKEAYSYEIEVAEGEEYDRYEDVTSLSRLEVRRK